MYQSVATATVRDAEVAERAGAVYGVLSTKSSASGSAPAADFFGAKRSVRNLTGK